MEGKSLPLHQLSGSVTQFFITCRRTNFKIHRVSKERPTFTTCYNFDVHSSIATIFGTDVAEKVGNQNVLYFPTSPN